jgi:sugar lactone lactonase YvrE
LTIVPLAMAATVEIAAEVDLQEPFAVAFGRNGDWYVCEYKAHRITRVGRDGKTSVVAGTGEAGDSGDSGPAREVRLRNPHEIVIARDGAMYIADTFNHRIRRLDLTSGTITPLAGTGQKGFSGDGGPAVKAEFNQAYGIALAPSGSRLYVCDTGNRRVRAIDLKTGIITTVAGNGASGVPSDGAQAAESPLVDPRAVAVGRRGELFILERRGNALRVVQPDGAIRTLLAPGDVNPPLNGPKHLAVDRQGNVLIVDTETHTIRKYAAKDRTVSTILGAGAPGAKLSTRNPLETELRRPHGVAEHSSGDLFISDSENNRVLRLRH